MNEIPVALEKEYLRAKGGGRRVLDRRIFTDPALFELEMERIFGRVWVYVAHESQVPRPHDFLTTWIGRVPAVINRDRDGKLNAFANICSHRGAVLCRTARGNATTYVCPFHGWTFDDQGQLVAPMRERGGGYPEAFDKHELGLRRIRMESYRGFLFANLDDKAGPLVDYLADSAAFIDLVADQAPGGIEVIRGSSTYTFNANWKMQIENGVDGYHVDQVHANYVQMTRNRAVRRVGGDNPKIVGMGDFMNNRGGFYDLHNGHGVLWTDVANPASRPLYNSYDELVARVGRIRADWMVRRSRNLVLYPNVFLMDQISTQIRVVRPLTVDKTEVTIFCFGPVGEAPSVRARRIRQYEDFFNASGMATPDDLTEFNFAQVGCAAVELDAVSDMSRGAAHEVSGPDEQALALGISPAASGAAVADEGIFIGQHRRWAELMGLAGDF
jgi:benzoate/toluate 1,2-dioxygenase alpha subunit